MAFILSSNYKYYILFVALIIVFMEIQTTYQMNTPVLPHRHIKSQGKYLDEKELLKQGFKSMNN